MTKRRTQQRGMFLKDGKFQIYVPGRDGFSQRSTSTRDATVARKQKRLVSSLKDEQDWELLDAVCRGKLSLKRLYAFHVVNALEQLRMELRSCDLSEHLDAWYDWVIAGGQTAQTARTYRSQATTLIEGRFPAHELTRQRVSKWLNDIPGITTGTRRKYRYALGSFVRFLIEREVLEADPTAGVRTPKKNKARLVWQTEEIDQKIVDAAPKDFQALFALIKATGAEVSPAIAMTRDDIDLATGLVHIRGTKNEARDRHDAIIEPWALPYLREHCRSLIGNIQLWPGLTRYRVYDVHQAACTALGIEDYTLRDARHSWAVRSRKRGESLEAIAAQLGHKSIYMAATVYGQFKPTIEERKERKGAAS